jgi:hypothetical protein
MTEGYVTKLAVDAGGEIIGYQFLRVGPMLEAIKKGADPREAYDKNLGTYGRFGEADKYIDPRHE